jgi:hypothetical protein
MLDEHDFRRVGEVRIGQFLAHLGIIQHGMATGYLDMPPACQRREHDEQVCRSVAPVFAIVSSGPPRLRRDWNTRFGDALLRRLVHADHRAFRVARPLINVQYVFHGGHERGIDVVMNDPLLLQVRLENVFLRTAYRVVAGSFNDLQFDGLFFQLL